MVICVERGGGTLNRDLKSMASSEDVRLSGQRRGRNCIDPDFTCPPLPAAGRDSREGMDLILMILWRIVEILRKFPWMWGRLGKWLGDRTERHRLSLHRFCLEKSLTSGKRKMDASFQGKAGFRNIMKVDFKSTLGSLLSILPCQVSMNLSFSLSHLRPLSLLS